MHPALFDIASLVLTAAALQDPGLDLIRRYVQAMRIQNATPRNAEVEVTIEARLPKLNKQATLRTVRSISAAGTVLYRTLESGGDSMVRREVIARYLAAESEGRKTEDIAITPVNYQFRFKGVVPDQTRRIYVFQLAPKRKQVGLFRGELWVDGQTALPVHEAGRFVKSPSVFIRRIYFTRDYATRDGSSVPIHLHSSIESRIAGRVELDIHFGEQHVE